MAAALPVGPCVVLVQDREADVFAFLAAPRPTHMALVVRVCQPRGVEVEAGAEGGPGNVLAAARQAPVVGQLPVQVPRKPGQPEREAVLELAASAVQVKAPRRRTADVRAGTLALWVVRATELAPPAGGKPIEWMLLTTLAIDSFATASRCVHYYALRWRVEVCQSQPVKMSWGPLRLLAPTIIYLRGRVKREDIGDINVLPCDDDFFNQTLSDGLAILEREAVQVLTQELAKALGIIDDLLPMGSLLVRLG